MTSLLKRFRWWRQRRRREEELRAELQFHLEEETERRQSEGLSPEEARRAARRDLGNPVVLREETRALWSWIALEQLAQDVRYAVRGMVAHRTFTALAALSLALGIGANTAIFSFMDAILVRSLPVHDPASLVVLKWRAKPRGASGGAFVMHSGDGRTYVERGGVTGPIFPYPAFDRLQTAAPALATIFAHKPGGNMNVIVDGQAEPAQGEYVSGDFFRGLSLVPAAGRLLDAQDDRADAAPVAVLSLAYSERRCGDAAAAVGRRILINNVTFTVVGVAPAEFFGVDPAAAPQVYVPMHAGLLLQRQNADGVISPDAFVDPNYYWVEMMGRLKPGVDLAQAQAALAGPFTQWVAATATADPERSNLPGLVLENGAGGLDSLRRQYSQPLYVLLTMVALILAIACANTANLLLARAAARRREMAVRLSLGAGRWRIVRQLLTESVLLAALSGGLGVFIAVAGIRTLTRLLGNGQQGFTLHAGLNWQVLLVTLALSVMCGVLFGLAPALQATRPSLMPSLKDRAFAQPGGRLRAFLPRLRLTQALVVAQIATSLLLLVAAALFVRTLANLQAVPLGFDRDHVLLFQVNATQAGYQTARIPGFYADLRRRLGQVAGVRGATLSHASLIRAGRSSPVTVDGREAERTRLLWAGPQFLATMDIAILRGRDLAETDRDGAPAVAIVSDLFAKKNFGAADPIGRHLEIGGLLRVNGTPRVMEIVGVAADVRYGGLKGDAPPVVYVSYAQVPPRQLGPMTYALHVDGDPLRYVERVRQAVRDADPRVTMTAVKTQRQDIEQTINQEIVFARLCSAFAILALVIACVGLYATMAYAVARRTGEIGLRMALGAERRSVTWMVLRDVLVLAGVGIAIGLPAAIAASRLVGSLLFAMAPGDPRSLAAAAVILTASALIAGYWPARRAARVEPMVALRHE